MTIQEFEKIKPEWDKYFEKLKGAISIEEFENFKSITDLYLKKKQETSDTRCELQEMFLKVLNSANSSH